MNTGYTTPGVEHNGYLAARHRRVLEKGSGIDPNVIAERGVRTATRARGQLPATYSWRQKKRAPGILFAVHRPNGETATIFRPDKPNPKNPGHKYEQPCKHLGGSGNVLDVHPSLRHLIDDVSAPVVFVEGIKKADAITSAARVAGVDLLVVAIPGVWNWLSEGEPISDIFDVPVSGRKAIICYDSDLWRNPDVQGAAERLAAHLTPRGAEVWIVYLSDQADGSKTGADDFLAAGGTLEELLGLARPYSADDLRRVKLTRNEKLRRALAYLTRRGEELPARSRRDCSKRAAWRAFIRRAEERGKLAGDGIEVVMPSMTGAELAAMGAMTFWRCTNDLIEDGLIRRKRAEKREHADSYILLIPGGLLRIYDGGNGAAGERGRETAGEGESPRGISLITPLPELRWSSPGRKARRGVSRGTRRVRQGRSLMEDRPSIRRPGKKRGEIIAYLIARGGSATRSELLARFGGPKTTWRNFKKQALADLLGRRRSYQGQELSMGPPIITLTDAGAALVPNWREALDQHRVLGEEEEAGMRQQRDHLRQRIAYRRRKETKADRAPTEEDVAVGREDRYKRQRIEKLVAQGMARAFAVRQVLGVDGFIGELRLAEDPVDRDPPGEPVVEEEHDLACECLDCSVPLTRYATPFGEFIPRVEDDAREEGA